MAIPRNFLVSDIIGAGVAFQAGRWQEGLWALSLSCLLIGCGDSNPAIPAAPRDESPVVATVGDVPITFADLQAVAAQNAYDLSDAGQREKALRDSVNAEILFGEAQKAGYDQDPEIRRYVKAQAVQKLLLATVDKQQGGGTPTEAELKAYYAEHLAEFTPPTLAKAQILGLVKRPGQEAVFEEKLKAVHESVSKKEIPFGDLVARYSDDPAAQSYGGTTNWLVKGEGSRLYPAAVLEAVFSAPDDKSVAGPIEHKDWVYFVKLVERREGQADAYDSAKQGIVQRIQRQRRLDAYDRFVGELRGAAEVRTFPAVLDSRLEALKSQAGPPMGPVSLPAAK
jgi:parvulin-like peptidyl-prolyl isomerase